MEVLNMSENQISTIDAFSMKYLTKLKQLDLSMNYITSWSSINKLPLNYMSNLKILNLSYNMLGDASELHLKSNSLSTLKLINCSIQDISGEFLKGFPNLTELDLSYNRLKEIHKFPFLSKLTVLNLEHNFIHDIVNDAFINFAYLDKLILNRNYRLRILNITSDSLKVLEAKYCNLEHVNLNKTVNLVSLLLNGNSLRYVPYMKLVNLNYLDLSNNKISIIGRNVFKSLESLTYLFLSYNTITSIHYRSFSTNFLLKTLDLSRNYIKDLPKFNIEALKTLNMSKCEIVSVQKDCLERMPFLENLILSENLLTKLPNNFNNTNLKVLNLTLCRITSINNLTFASMPHLTDLYLTGNHLFSDIHPSYFYKIDRVYLDENVWRCDCKSKSFKELYDWLDSKKSKDLTCQFPEDVEGKTWIQACYKEWYDGKETGNPLFYCIIVFVTMIVIFCVFMTIKRTSHIREEQRQRELEQERRDEEERTTRERQENERRQAFQNAPDPRESQRPPSYTEALLMPKLNGSCGSLSDSRHSIAGSRPNITGSKHSITGSRKSLNSISSKKDIQKKVRRKRRPRSRSMDSQQGCSRENIDTSDTDSDVIKKHTLYKESRI